MSTSSNDRSGRSGGQGDDPAPRPSRRVFSPEYKLAIVAEYENAPNGEKGKILRREGLYSSHIIEWTRARDAGALTTGSGKTGDAGGAGPKRERKTAEQLELEKLRRENEKLKSDLGKSRMALDIMGKAHALLEDISGSADKDEPPRRS
ncbi:transposase [Saccharopolyspora elongata]|uniref:Transposase n=1 Tax=Saccharopolyspora elongata TaxID=2530387 RepID=A0A4R4XMU2_9PSEU|nr:transposase [Saccharopolyspora elongata]TDD32284.1 transposase [Saccharopolyspora elongata]